MQEQLDKINEALKNLNEVFEDFEAAIIHRNTHSNCCDALLVNDVCSKCKEHADNQNNDK
jgi:hypothetical protein